MTLFEKGGSIDDHSSAFSADNNSSKAPANFSFSSDDAFPAKLSFCLLLPSVLALTIVFAVAIYKKVDVAHPVFAVIFQA